MLEIEKKEQELQPRHFFFVVVGPIAGGKTKLVNLMTRRLGLVKREEIFQDNPYLEDFYSGKEKECAFDSQMFFLTNDAVKRIKIGRALSSSSIVEDQGVEGDFVLESVQKKMGWISDENHEVYLKTYSNIVNDPSFIKPDIVIAVTAPKPVIRRRIIKRGREMELTMMESYPEYFNRVVDAFNDWVGGLKSQFPVIEVDTGRHDFVLESNMQDFVIGRIIDGTREFVQSQETKGKVIIPAFLEVASVK